eukprot:c13328_g1_i1.p2 GENE.c13328_g1_i1~~c13328_g1_i1.p2  ORF type:complete len:114 (-),score=24.58 c13328_g1_i1:197-538(-)
MAVAFATIAAILAGPAAVLQYTGLQMPETVVENKWTALLMVYFLANTIATNLNSSGAFEVSYGGTQVFSKLEAGYAPSYGELVSRLQAVGVLNAAARGGSSMPDSGPYNRAEI